MRQLIVCFQNRVTCHIFIKQIELSLVRQVTTFGSRSADDAAGVKAAPKSETDSSSVAAVPVRRAGSPPTEAVEADAEADNECFCESIWEEDCHVLL